jgi:hypothetical protein
MQRSDARTAGVCEARLDLLPARALRRPRVQHVRRAHALHLLVQLPSARVCVRARHVSATDDTMRGLTLGRGAADGKRARTATHQPTTACAGPASFSSARRASMTARNSVASSLRRAETAPRRSTGVRCVNFVHRAGFLRNAQAPGAGTRAPHTSHAPLARQLLESRLHGGSSVRHGGQQLRQASRQAGRRHSVRCTERRSAAACARRGAAGSAAGGGARGTHATGGEQARRWDRGGQVFFLRRCRSSISIDPRGLEAGAAGAKSSARAATDSKFPRARYARASGRTGLGRRQPAGLCARCVARAGVPAGGGAQLRPAGLRSRANRSPVAAGWLEPAPGGL